jgi:ribokinase
VARILVVGSTNVDLVVQVPRIPGAGETVLGDRFFTADGGKGANQAVAAARLGAEVTFLGRFGADPFGDRARSQLEAEGLDLAPSRQDPVSPHGVALILVDPGGENAIAVAPGANTQVSPHDIEAARPNIAAADLVLLQLEVPLPAVERAVDLAGECGVPVLLNPAPARELPNSLLTRVDYLTPNEHEACLLAGSSESVGAESPQEAADTLCALGVSNVLVTLGSRGVWVASGDERFQVPAPQVNAIDATGAGDAFCGALAVALAEGKLLREGVHWAATAAALSTTCLGAQPSLPRRGDVEAFLARGAS